MQHAAKREGSGDVAFYLIDAAFSDLGDLLRYHYRKDVGLPLDPLVYGYASLVNYLRDGYFLGDASPRRSIAGVRTPMLFIHGRADTVIPYRMTEELYKAQARREVASHARRRAWVDRHQGRRKHGGEPRAFRAEGG